MKITIDQTDAATPSYMFMLIKDAYEADSKLDIAQAVVHLIKNGPEAVKLVNGKVKL